MIPKHDNSVAPTTGRGHYKVTDDSHYQEKATLPYQAKKAWHYGVGEELWVYTSVEGLGVNYYKFTYTGQIGVNLYFKRTTIKQNELVESFRLVDYEFGLVEVYNNEEFKEHKKQIVNKEMLQWEKSKSAQSL
jgi:hypothetical protein